MNQSESIQELAGALAKAQGEIVNASKNAKNPHFNSSFADLASVVNAVRGPFSKNGLSWHQGVKNGETLSMVTRIIHSSGQWIEDDGVPLLLDKQNMQGLGSAQTYARRYGLMAAAGIAPEDDDGNAAVKNTAPEAKPIQGTAKRGTAKNGNGTQKRITLTWADGKTRDWPATKKGALEAVEALEGATTANADNWHANESLMLSLASNTALVGTKGEGDELTFDQRVYALRQEVTGEVPTEEDPDNILNAG